MIASARAYWYSSTLLLHITGVFSAFIFIIHFFFSLFCSILDLTLNILVKIPIKPIALFTATTDDPRSVSRSVCDMIFDIPQAPHHLIRGIHLEIYNISIPRRYLEKKVRTLSTTLAWRGVVWERMYACCGVFFFFFSPSFLYFLTSSFFGICF